jgi:hypothetical protein
LGCTFGLSVAIATQGTIDYVKDQAEDSPPSDEKKDRLRPGPYAGDGVPADGPGRPSKEKQKQVNEEGEKHGCHTCGTKEPGTKSGNWIGDHQPATALNPEGEAQTLYPHCVGDSCGQGGDVKAEKGRRGIK